MYVGGVYERNGIEKYVFRITDFKNSVEKHIESSKLR